MITADTDLYCILGSPVSHSKSPAIHNAAFDHHHIDAVYLAFEPPNAGSGVDALRSLGIKGASVTIPFKEAVIPFLDWIHPDATAIGAVNTIARKEDRLMGFNTDAQAAMGPLKAYCLREKTVCIAGAGGAARAVAFAIANEGGRLIITNRTRKRGQILADDTGAEFIPLEAAGSVQADILINTTSLGMPPHVGQKAFPDRIMKPGMVVMDVVYTPMETTLIRAARQNGCTVIDGLAMFVAQAAAQFELWTGITPDPDEMRKSILTDQGDLI